MPINQLYGEILGNTKDVTREESETINYWYIRVLGKRPIVGHLTCAVLRIYKRRTMDYRDHIADAIKSTTTC